MSRKHDDRRAFDLAFSHWCWNWRADSRPIPVERPVPSRQKPRLSAPARWLETWYFTRASHARREALEAFFVTLGRAAEAGDRRAYTDLFLPDATVFLPDHPPLLGRDQIGDWFDDLRRSFVPVQHSYLREEIRVVGPVAMIRSRGIGRYLVRATEETFPFDRRYLDVLRYADGNWYMAYHVESGTQSEHGIWDRG